MNLASISLDPETLRKAYAEGLKPRALFAEVLRRVASWNDPALFISLGNEKVIGPVLDRLESSSPASLPLYGLPFTIKDNIDVAGFPTTAACPDFAYNPQRSATVVERLVAAGAIPVGKVNLDQFATGLVGVRSPYGTPRNPVVPGRIPGGSSSGSACSVSAGLASFSLGTDTAGSGRVPAAFQGLYGIKPSLGRISCRGVVPACRSLDCVSIFARKLETAKIVLSLAEGFDPEDPYSRRYASSLGGLATRRHWNVAVPRKQDLIFGDNTAYQKSWERSLEGLRLAGADVIEVDFSPFRACAELLYAGPWVAERLEATGELLERSPDSLHPVVRGIVENAKKWTALDVWKARAKLGLLRHNTDALLSGCDLLLTPTVPTHPDATQVAADPVGANSLLGTYTNFVNLLDRCALALPAGLAEGQPFGVTLSAKSGEENLLYAFSERFGEPLATGTVEPGKGLQRDRR